MSSKNPLVHTTEKMVKEGINDMETKPNLEYESITHTIAKNKFDSINETDKPKTIQSEKDKSIRNELNKGIALDKLRSLDKSSTSQRTET